MAVSKRLRYEVLRRDNHQCKYCGAGAPDVALTVDHVVPVALGGRDDASNLVAACKDCNAGKSVSSPDAALVADVDAKAVAWAQAMEVVVARRATELEAERKRINKFDRKWRTYRTYGELYPRDPNWRNSVARFLAHGLDDQFIADAVETAVGRPRMPVEDVWKYFCGICWREINDLQDATRSLLDGPPASIDRATPDPEMPLGAGLDPRFDALNLASLYVADLVNNAALPGHSMKWAVRGLWNGMEAAYKQFLKAPDQPELEEDDPVVEAFEMAAASDLIQLWEECGRPGRVGTASCGAGADVWGDADGS